MSRAVLHRCVGSAPAFSTRRIAPIHRAVSVRIEFHGRPALLALFRSSSTCTASDGEAPPDGQGSTTVVGQFHVGASRRRAAPRIKAVASPHGGLRRNGRERGARHLRTHFLCGYAPLMVYGVSAVPLSASEPAPRPNPSFHPTASSGLRPLPSAGELKR